MNTSAPPPRAQPDGGPAWMPAILDLLLTASHIDGQFHRREQTFIHRYIESVVSLVEAETPAAERARVRDGCRDRLYGLYDRLRADVGKLSAEVRWTGDEAFVPETLRDRAVTIFRRLTSPEQSVALELAGGAIHADGRVTTAERLLLDDLVAQCAPPLARTVTRPAQGGVSSTRPVRIAPIVHNPLKSLDHPLLEPLEQTYSPHPIELQAQVARDYQLVEQAIAAWNRRREHGNGWLTGIADIEQVPAGTNALDGYVHILRPDRPLELVVLGDLHGCYGCLKAALLQSDFINRAWAHQWDPGRYPDVKLVLLGDYIDRGRFSFDGVLRTVLQVLVTMPDQVIMLRGNHEYFLRYDQHVYSGVHPAEALASILPHVPAEMLEAYRVLFENMPTSLLCDRVLFVHGGIPRDESFATRYRDLSSLGDPELRFQMLWSDPVDADRVEPAVQLQSSRFTFGRDQFRGFMERVGVHTLIRGHEQIDRGFEVVYDLGDRLLLNLFSAGGHDNRDSPADASYRRVVPMALSLYFTGAEPTVTPWPIDYGPFNYDVHNRFHRARPLLEFRYD